VQGSVSNPEQHGIVPRAVQALGEGIAADASDAEYEVRLLLYLNIVVIIAFSQSCTVGGMGRFVLRGALLSTRCK